MSVSLDIGALLAGTASLVQTQIAFRDAVQQARIADKPTEITLKRDGASLPVQTVRIEFNGGLPGSAVSDTGIGYAQRGVLFGLSTLDAKEFDIFVLGVEEYTITQVNRSLLGQVQCQFEAV